MQRTRQGGAGHMAVVVGLAVVLLGTLPMDRLEAQRPDSFVVQVYHGRSLGVISGPLPRGIAPAVVNNPWVMRQGSKVCLQVVNAHPLKYAYSIGQIIDSTTAPDLKLPEIAGTIAGAFGGAAIGGGGR